MWGNLLLVSLLSLLASNAASPGLVDVIYPPVENGPDARTPLYFSLIQSFSGQYISVYSLPGLHMALDFINQDNTLLPGYSLHYVFTDAAVRLSRY